MERTTQPGIFSPAWRRVRQILSLRRNLTSLADAELTRRAMSLAWRARGSTPLSSLLVEGFALAAEAVHRVEGFELYPVQLYGGLILSRGGIAEMQTGEGKTLTAVAPVFVQALMGRGCHVMTSNPYLAQRDADELSPIYRLLGMTVGCVGPDAEPPERKAAYQCDITYGTANEFGFDYLRDRLQNPEHHDDDPFQSLRSGITEGTVQRGRHYALVDEADSILLDDARTPLIIALPEPVDEGLNALLKWCTRVAQTLKPEDDFVFEAGTKVAHLTEHGCTRVVLTERPGAVSNYPLEIVYQHVETALRGIYGFVRDAQYLVRDGEVHIVDESTGRSLEGRRWQAGLHQIVEILEGLEPSAENKAAAQITMQRYMRLYPLVAGMTGTAASASMEFRRLYKLKVHRIPTHRPCIRELLPPRIFSTAAAKDLAIVDVAVEKLAAGRSVLIGTPSIHASERLSTLFNGRGIDHRVLNARQDEAENHIVESAGQPGMLTIATNMAGRGTDIKLHSDVRKAGGLHVIATEYHSSKRIDRQLVGRAARQGDPGSAEFFISLDDELFLHVPEKLRRRWQRAARRESRGELWPGRWLSLFQRVQRQVERRHAKDRRKGKKSEHKRWDTLRQMGLDPCLDLAEES